jgi:hypothetical protein
LKGLKSRLKPQGYVKTLKETGEKTKKEKRKKGRYWMKRR